MTTTNNNTGHNSKFGASFQVVRTPGWVVYGEHTTLAAAQASADAAQKTDDGGNVFVHMEACDERPITMRTHLGNLEVVE